MTNGVFTSFRAGRTYCVFFTVAAVSALSQNSTPQHVTLAEAVRLAQANEGTFVSAQAAQRTAKIDSYLAKAALLPSLTYHNEALYTQPNGETTVTAQGGGEPGFVFIANNAVREYVSQASIDERVGFKALSDVNVARATAVKAAAGLEVARRGLLSTVVGLYYAVTANDRKRAFLAQALGEAQTFTRMTQEREAARESAHADVVKAQLQEQQRRRDLTDAVLVANKTRLELGVLLFKDPRTPYVTDPPGELQSLPARQEINRMAGERSPEIRSALADVNVATAGLTSARAAYLPDLALNFSYGIDAPQFAAKGPGGVTNLGYSMGATLDVPVFNWFATQKRIQQAEIRRDVAKVALSTSQRRLIANLEESYAEAVATREQLALLEESVKTAGDSLRLTTLRYGAGESTALEVVDAQNSFISAEVAQADGVVRYQTSLTSLQVLTGTF